jgi:hypothetical protein
MTSILNISQKTNIRCFFCNKKCNLENYECKCNNIYCSNHRLPFNHSCLFDHKKEQMDKLKKTNILVKTDKLERI